jgi:hypothetical protein
VELLSSTCGVLPVALAPASSLTASSAPVCDHDDSASDSEFLSCCEDVSDEEWDELEGDEDTDVQFVEENEDTSEFDNACSAASGSAHVR